MAVKALKKHFRGLPLGFRADRVAGCDVICGRRGSSLRWCHSAAGSVTCHVSGICIEPATRLPAGHQQWHFCRRGVGSSRLHRVDKFSFDKLVCTTYAIQLHLGLHFNLMTLRHTALGSFIRTQ